MRKFRTPPEEINWILSKLPAINHRRISRGTIRQACSAHPILYVYLRKKYPQRTMSDAIIRITEILQKKMIANKI